MNPSFQKQTAIDMIKMLLALVNEMSFGPHLFIWLLTYVQLFKISLFLSRNILFNPISSKETITKSQINE